MFGCYFWVFTTQNIVYNVLCIWKDISMLLLFWFGLVVIPILVWFDVKIDFTKKKPKKQQQQQQKTIKDR